MTKVAIALGAGGARGIAHVHALQAFDELGVKPCQIAGTSFGSIMGAAYSAGMSGAEIAAFVEDSFANRAGLFSKVYKVLPSSVSSFIADGGLRLGEINLENLFPVFLPEAIPENFEDLSIPLLVVATDFYGEASTCFNTGKLRNALAASSAMPAIFLPVCIDGRFYIDGGSTNPCPLDLLHGDGVQVIAIDVSGGTRKAADVRPSKADALYASNQIMQQTIVRLNAQRHPGAVVLRPPVNPYRALDFLKVSEILATTAPLKDLVKRQVDAAMRD